jgi:hypothetical protein
MKKRILRFLVCAMLVFALAGCDLVASIFWPTVTLTEAKEAWTAFLSSFAAVNTDATIDNGSTSSTEKLKNSAGTLFYEGPKVWSFPASDIYTFDRYNESMSGYLFKGTLKRTFNSATTGTLVFDLDLSDPVKHVKNIGGTYELAATPDQRRLKFNNEEFTLAQLNTP